MTAAQNIISRFRRDLLIGSVVQTAFMVLLAISLFGGPIVGTRIDERVIVFSVLLLWGLMFVQSIRNAAAAAEFPAMIASGQFDLAEQHIVRTLRRMWLPRGGRLLSLHHLAVLRHAQRRYGEAVQLADAAVRASGKRAATLRKTGMLLMLDSALEVNDLHAAHAALVGLAGQPFSLGESITLLGLQLDYQSRVSDFGPMAQGIEAKIQLAELMPTAAAARTQAMLALAAMRVGRTDFAEWLRKRAELLVDKDELVQSRPVLGAVWNS